MAILSTNYPTLGDLVSRLDDEGNIAPIAEVLNQCLPILKDLGFVECNKTDGYLHTIRTGLPEPTWRKLYQGVQPKKSTTATTNAAHIAAVESSSVPLRPCMKAYAWRWASARRCSFSRRFSSLERLLRAMCFSS